MMVDDEVTSCLKLIENMYLPIIEDGRKKESKYCDVIVHF